MRQNNNTGVSVHLFLVLAIHLPIIVKMLVFISMFAKSHNYEYHIFNIIYYCCISYCL